MLCPTGTGCWAGLVKHPVPEPKLDRLREIFNAKRIEHDQTFDVLAEKTGLARQTLLNISSGKYRGDLRTWVILAKVWGESLDALLAPIWDD